MKLQKRRLFQLQNQSRKRKFDLFMEIFRPSPTDRILDLGGGDGSYFLKLYPWRDKVTIVDINRKALNIVSSQNRVCGNALMLPFENQSFDIVWSNALIEHVGDFSSQILLATEIKRMGDRFFITTPWKGFPVELHFRLPLYQFVPKSVQQILSRHVSIGWYQKGSWEPIYLLWQYQLKMLFPEAIITKQRVTLWPETLIAYKN